MDKQFFDRVLRVKEIGALSGLIIVMLIFTFLSDSFLTWRNFVGIFTTSSELGIIAIGICFLMIAGEFDLSVGSVFAVAPMLGAKLANSGIPMFFAFLILSFLQFSILHFVPCCSCVFLPLQEQ